MKKALHARNGGGNKAGYHRFNPNNLAALLELKWRKIQDVV
jgi:hypothetical protein